MTAADLARIVVGMTACRHPLPRLLLAAVLLSGGLACRVERFTAEQCRCLADQPQVRGWGDELGLRRCAAGMGGQGEATYDELQCRTWLQSPWLARPPDDDVAGRVVPWGNFLGDRCRRREWFRCEGHMEAPWAARMANETGYEVKLGPNWRQEQAPSTRFLAAQAYDTRIQAELAAVGADETQTVALVAATKRVLGPGPCADSLQSVGVKLRVLLYPDGTLQMAALRPWHTVPPVRPGGAGAPAVNVAAAVNELSGLQSAGVQRGVVLGIADGAKWRDVWLLLWALDVQLHPDRTGRHMRPYPADSEHISGGAALLESGPFPFEAWTLQGRGWPACKRDELGLAYPSFLYDEGWDRDPFESSAP